MGRPDSANVPTKSVLAAFPSLTTSEFDVACDALAASFDTRGHRQSDWQAVEFISQHGSRYLRITRLLQPPQGKSGSAGERHDDDVGEDPDLDEELEDGDEEVLDTAGQARALILYDILLSPVYIVPVLYFHVHDPQHRYPPTMTVLYEHLIPPLFKTQAETGGVIGGISVQDHPVMSRPVFFIHPCQTAEVMAASAGDGKITAEEYLIMWIGALGKCVGLNVPLSLADDRVSD